MFQIYNDLVGASTKRKATTENGKEKCRGEIEGII